MNYIVKLMDGSKHFITEVEYLNLNGKTGLIFIPSTGETLNLLSVTSIYPADRDETYSGRSIDRNKQFEGMVAGGIRMVKRFGNWYIADGNKDDDGNPCVQLDPNYHPELLCGILPTPEEYESKFKDVPVENWPRLLSGADKELPKLDIGERNGQGFEKIGKTPETAVEKTVGNPA